MQQPAPKIRSIDDYREQRGGGGDSGDMPVRQEHEFTDVGAAQRFVKMFGASVRYIEATDEWRYFYSEFENGGRWVTDDIGAVDRMLKLMAQSIMDEEKPASWPTGPKAPDFYTERRNFYERIVGATRGNRFASIKRLVRSELPIPARSKEFDTNIWLLNLLNGTYELKKDEFRPTVREDMLTKQANAHYDPEAQLHYSPKCERCEANEESEDHRSSVWLRGLYSYFKNLDADELEELIKFIQRLLSYTLCGAVSERVIFILQGKRDAGKSTILRTMHHFLGDYATRIPMDSLMKTKTQDGERATPMLMRLLGARFVSALESDEAGTLAEGKIKELVGGDKLIGRDLHAKGRGTEFDATHKLLLGTNYMPRIKDPIVWAKIRCIRFEHSIPKNEQIPKEELDAALQLEFSGLLNWLLEGFRAWHKNGLGTCKAIEEATSAAQLEQDDLGAFLEDERWVRKGMVPKGVVLNQFNAWAASELGWKHDISGAKLGRMMNARDFVEDNVYLGGKKTKVWVGLSLKEGFVPPGPGADAVKKSKQLSDEWDNDKPLF